MDAPLDCAGKFLIRDLSLNPELVAYAFTQGDKLNDNASLPEG